MKITNGEIVAAREPIGKLMGMKLPVRISYALVRLARELETELKTIDDVRRGIVRKYGEADEKGNIAVPQTGEKLAGFLKEYGELLSQEVEIKSGKISIPEKVTGTCDACKHNIDVTLQIEPAVLFALDKFIEVT